MSKLLHVLVVEDSVNDAELMLEQIRGAGYEPMSERVQTAQELTASLGHHTWDVVLSDYVMPQFSGPEALKMVREKNPEIPFIVISGVYGEDAAVRMMKAGAGHRARDGGRANAPRPRQRRKPGAISRLNRGIKRRRDLRHQIGWHRDELEPRRGARLRFSCR